MRFNSVAHESMLLVAGALLCIGNVWYTAVRSTIPISIDATVSAKRLSTEHTPGLDDVCLLIMEDETTLHVDKPLFEVVLAGERLYKSAWSTEINHAGHDFDLRWSRDARTMAWVMPTTFLIFAILFRLAIRSRSPGAQSFEQPGIGE